LLEKIAGSKLKLTKCVRSRSTTAEPRRHDAELLAAFRTDFPEYFEGDYAALRKIDEDRMKSAEGKTRWRKFIAPFEKVIEDYNFGTLMRLDVAGEYTEANTIFGSLRWFGIAQLIVQCCEYSSSASRSRATRSGVRAKAFCAG